MAAVDVKVAVSTRDRKPESEATLEAQMGAVGKLYGAIMAADALLSVIVSGKPMQITTDLLAETLAVIKEALDQGVATELFDGENRIKMQAESRASFEKMCALPPDFFLTTELPPPPAPRGQARQGGAGISASPDSTNPFGPPDRMGSGQKLPA